MKIELYSLKVSELVKGYTDKGEEGVRGYDGKLNIRPAYQREFIYKGHEFRIEVKSLQTNTIKRESDGTLTARFQCDASDRRTVTLLNGHSLETTCLVVGEFDILAVNMFEFRQKWEFAFALNEALPRSSYAKYLEDDRQFLLSSLMPISLPLQAPYSADLYVLLDKAIAASGR